MRAILALCGCGAVVLLSVAGRGSGGVVQPSIPAHLGAERVRLRAHFDSVLLELATRDLSGLTAAQRASRAELTTWLREYRDAGAFPLNDVSAATVPIFRDSRGVLCAMAYLIHRSGRSDIVDHVERTRNTAYIAELTDDSSLIAWLDSTGLTASEAARIQPTYSPPPPSHAVHEDYAFESLIIAGAAIATTTANLIKPSNLSGVLGTLTGAIALLGVIVGPPAVSGDVVRREDSTIDAFVAVSGIAALATGIHALTRSDERAAAASNVRHARGMVVVSPGEHPVTGTRTIRVGVWWTF